MFKKSILSAATIATIAATTAACGVTTATAGGYGGYGGGYGNGGGYYQSHKARPSNRLWRRHVAWCYDRFDSYNAHDNTYQPYHGPRRQCWSPFYRG